MKVILKIEEYLREKNSVVFKTCRLHSHKSIDEFGAKVVSCDDLNMTDCETFIESLVNKVSIKVSQSVIFKSSQLTTFAPNSSIDL
jgi:hypothetical protein